MKATILIMLFLSISGCTMINVTTCGDVSIDAHKDVVVSDPQANVEVPMI